MLDKIAKQQKNNIRQLEVKKEVARPWVSVMIALAITFLLTEERWWLLGCGVTLLAFRVSRHFRYFGGRRSCE